MKHDTFLKHLSAPVRKAEPVEKAEEMFSPAPDKVGVFPLESQEVRTGPRVADTGKDALGRPYEDAPALDQYDVLYSPKQ